MPGPLNPPQPDGGSPPEPADAAATPGIARHVPALDGLRALAILLVIPHNGDNFAHVARALVPLALVAHAGWIGVQLFFVLSGFLITGNLIDSRRASNYFSAFYARRVLRIFPLYFTTLIVGLLLLPALVKLSPEVLASFQHQVWYWTFLSNWTEPFGKGVATFPHFWSLAVEEQFYFIWPFVVHRLPERPLVVLAVVIAVVALTIRAILVAAGAPPAAAYMFTACRMDALALGAAAAALVRMPGATLWLRAHRRYLIWAALGTGLLAAALTNEFAAYDWTSLTYGQTLLGVAFALLILYAVLQTDEGSRSWIIALLSSAPMRSIGKYSYAMYVLHLPISLLIPPESFTALGLWAMGAYVLTIAVLSYIAGALSYHLLEKHFLRMKRWFTPQVSSLPRTSSADAATST
jgi:peptidoglycan/LPS O-acetylase OafA/YrhL